MEEMPEAASKESINESSSAVSSSSSSALSSSPSSATSSSPSSATSSSPSSAVSSSPSSAVLSSPSSSGSSSSSVAVSSSPSSAVSSSSRFSGSGNKQTVCRLLPRVNRDRWRHANSADQSLRRRPTSFISRFRMEHGGSKLTNRKPWRRSHRRKRATARERSRVLKMNSAFEALRNAVPQDHQLVSCCSGEAEDKSAKITTLRLALRYIAQLRILLGYEDSAAEASQMLSRPSTPSASLRSSDTCCLSSSLSSLSADAGTSAATVAQLSCDSTDLHSNDSQASNR